ncbi:MAG: hypothetical protein ACE5IL_02470 [Myxococcota bacterium]
MRLASRGLGRITLPIDFREAQVELREDGSLWLTGRIEERTVRWDYRMRLEDSDLVRFIALARRACIRRYLAERVGLQLVGRIARTLWSHATGRPRRVRRGEP